jgi:hypothetical protein
MRHHLRALALCAVFAATGVSLAACPADGVSLSSPSPVAGAAASTSADEKAWAGAEEAYNLAAKAYLIAVRQNLLTPAQKAQVKGILGTKGTATKALHVLRDAYAAGNTSSLTSQAGQVLRLVGDARALLPASAVKAAGQ